MFLGNSRLAEYALNIFLIFGKIPASTECPPKVSIFCDFTVKSLLWGLNR